MSSPALTSSTSPALTSWISPENQSSSATPVAVEQVISRQLNESGVMIVRRTNESALAFLRGLPNFTDFGARTPPRTPLSLREPSYISNSDIQRGHRWI